MRKIVITLLAVILVGQTVCAQSLNNLFYEYGQEKNAESVSLSPLLMSFAKLFMDKDDENEVVQKISSLKVLSMDDCPAEVKARFNKDAARIKFKGYEELMRVKEDEEHIRILMKQKDSVIRELVILVTGEDCALIRLKGKIRQEDINSLVNETSKN